MSYNGWKNRKTWSVALWAASDEIVYRVIAARNVEYTPSAAEQTVRLFWPDGTPDMGSNADYRIVDWYEVARAFNEY